jgi:hypothetical protein
MLFIFGDLQDTPDESTNFRYGSTKIAQHPLGIAKTCTDLGLTCTIYQHMDKLEKPITSRHGPKGGRFIDGMYTLPTSLHNITGISIIQDTGIFLDHDLVISKCNLGFQKFIIANDKEERIDFRRIMSIPGNTKQGHDHPTLRDDVFKGMEYKIHVDLYKKIQKVVKDPKLGFIEDINSVKRDLEAFQRDIIHRTKTFITMQEQIDGKLVQRTQSDAQRLNQASTQFFDIIYAICRQVGLHKLVPMVNNAINHKQRRDIATGKLIPDTAVVPVLKSLNESLKRTVIIFQRMQIAHSRIRAYQRVVTKKQNTLKETRRIEKAIERILNQQPLLLTSIRKTCNLCEEIVEDRMNHIQAIQHTRRKTLYDDMNEYQEAAIVTQGIETYHDFMRDIKIQVFGQDFTEKAENGIATTHKRAHTQLTEYYLEWDNFCHKLKEVSSLVSTASNTKIWHKIIKKGKQLSKKKRCI